MKRSQGVENNAVKAITSACVTSYQKLAARIEQVKEQILAEVQKSLQVPDKLFKLALNEAEALAWQTGYPHLVFPVLAAEKIQAAGKWTAQQEFLRRKNSTHGTSI